MELDNANRFFPEVKRNFGFGCMRFPMLGEDVDIAQVKEMTDLFMESGFNYFDTAHGYISKKSEPALKAALTSRYPREAYTLTDKLSDGFFETEADIVPFFESQLEILGVDYLDFYLMHAQNASNFEKYKRCRAYETAFELKKQGKIRHVGISFHDTADVLDQILTEYPQIEVVQIQLNYLDWEDPSVQSRLCYEVCVKHKKPVIVMEPVKGGSLVNLNEKAQSVFDELRQAGGGNSNAGYALRYAAGFENIFMVISGMSDLEQMRDNISFMKDFQPLNAREKEAVQKVCDIFASLDLIPCTGCHYCTDGCPMEIKIPEIFSCLNKKTQFGSWNQNYYYNNVLTQNAGKASDCIGCGQCEDICPQKLKVTELLAKAAAEFEKK